MENNLPIISPCQSLDLQDGSLVKLNLDRAQHTEINTFVANIPALLAANELADAYVIKFPKNVSGMLMRLRDGGFGSSIVGENGNFVSQTRSRGAYASCILPYGSCVWTVLSIRDKPSNGSYEPKDRSNNGLPLRR